MGVLTKALRTKEKISKQECEKLNVSLQKLQKDYENALISLKEKEKECNILKNLLRSRKRTDKQAENSEFFENELMKLEETAITVKKLQCFLILFLKILMVSLENAEISALRVLFLCKILLPLQFFRPFPSFK